MRQAYHAQLPLVAQSDHPRAAELAAMSLVLDENRGGLRAVQADLLRIRRADAKRGRRGMTAEQVVRAAIVKQMLGLSYEELSFRIGDSLQLRAFCRLSPADASPKKSTLQSDIGAIRPESWEALNKTIVKDARDRKVEDGRWMRTDTTVVESNIHHPLDSLLLWDGVRVLTRIMQRAHDDYGTTRTNFKRRAKRRSVAILHAKRMDRRVPLYRDLLKVTRKTVLAAETSQTGTALELGPGHHPIARRQGPPFVRRRPAGAERFWGQRVVGWRLSGCRHTLRTSGSDRISGVPRRSASGARSTNSGQSLGGRVRRACRRRAWRGNSRAT